MKFDPSKISRFLATSFVCSLLLVSRAQAAPGDLDPNFGIGGKLVAPFAGWLVVNRTLLQPDGKFLTIGFDDGPSERFSFRHNGSGIFDTTFGMIAPESNVDFFDFSVQSDLKIVAVRDEGYPIGGVYRLAFGLHRFNSDGTIDTSFGTNGVVTTRIANNSMARYVAIQSDGKIVVAGIATENLSPYPISGSNHKIALARYHPNGTLDATFGTDGVVISDSGSCRLYLQPDDKLLCRNYETVNRYNPNGTPDVDFGINGTISVGPDSGGMVVQTNGKIVTGTSDSSQPMIHRYMPNGAVDTTFGTNGHINSPYAARALAVQQNGKVVAAGNLNSNSVISRYDQNGTIDKAFGTNGNVITTFENATGSRIHELILQPDNKIVATASAEFGSGYNSSPAIVRYLNDPVETIFEISGKVSTPDGRGLRNAVVTLTDSQGIARTATTSSFGIYLFDGVTPDASYTITVSSKRYRFATRNIEVNSSLANVDFIGME